MREAVPLKTVRALIAFASAMSAAGCSSFHGLHSARALPINDREFGVEVSHQSVPAAITPLLGVDPRIESNGVDVGGRFGRGDGTDLSFRMGTSGLEGSLLHQLSDPANRWFAVAGLVSTRGRIVFASTNEAWRLLDVVVSIPFEFDPHPRLALIAEPKGMVSLSVGCGDAGVGCDYYPLHASVSGGARLRLLNGWVLGAEGAWYPISFNGQRGAAARPTSWEASVSLSWAVEAAEGNP